LERAWGEAFWNLFPGPRRRRPVWMRHHP
jgi:hypothetical protein